MLREKIQKIIQASKSTEAAAKMVCFWLESEIDLYGNGWFDDDEFMTKILEKSEDNSNRSYEKMAERISQILTR